MCNTPRSNLFILTSTQMAHSEEGMDPHSLSEESFAQAQAMNDARKPRKTENEG
jgi:hypothetical protein